MPGDADHQTYDGRDVLTTEADAEEDASIPSISVAVQELSTSVRSFLWLPCANAAPSFEE